MFYLVDLYKHARYAFQDAAALACYWRATMGLDFSQLNLTGKDFSVVRYADHYAYSDTLGCDIPIYMTSRVLRRYQVQDEHGRSVDIRTWAPELFEPLPRQRFTGWFTTGAKSRWHRRSGPSMLRSAMRAAEQEDIPDEILQRYDINPNQIATRVGNMSCYEHECYYERMTKTQRSRSWKDQTKSRKQYAKHKANTCRTADKHQAKLMPLDIDHLLQTA